MYVKLFVGNLSWGVDDAMLEEVFRAHGEVQPEEPLVNAGQEPRESSGEISGCRSLREISVRGLALVSVA